MTAQDDPTETLRLPPRDGGVRGWRNTFWSLVGIAGLAAVLVAAGLYTAPALLSDWQVRDTARPVADARVSEGRCSSRIVVNICDVTLGLRTPSGVVTRRVNYVFTGVHLGDYGIRVMADPARPELVTTDLGLDRLWNRTVTLLVIMGGLGICLVAVLVAFVRNRRAAGPRGRVGVERGV